MATGVLPVFVGQATKAVSFAENGRKVYEAVLQLRGAAGERQVADANTAVVTTGGGTPSGVLLLRS